MDETKSPSVPCPRCGQAMRSAKVKTAIWREEQLFLVEEIPAQVCDWCIEQFYDEATTDALRRLTEDGFSSLAPKREVLVPVFSLEEQIRKGAATEEETHADY